MFVQKGLILPSDQLSAICSVFKRAFSVMIKLSHIVALIYIDQALRFELSRGILHRESDRALLHTRYELTLPTTKKKARLRRNVLFFYLV